MFKDKVVDWEQIQESTSLCIIGGSFDPFSVAHREIGIAVFNAYNPSFVIYLPAFRNPLKKNAPSCSDKDRLEMIYLSINDMPYAKISTVEIDSKTQIYTVETLTLFNLKCPNSKLYFAIGSDNLTDPSASLPYWKDPDRLLKLCTFIIIPRAGFKLSDIDALKHPLYSPSIKAALKKNFLDVKLPDISSSEIRERVRRGKPLTGLVVPKVESLIAERGLYKL